MSAFDLGVKQGDLLGNNLLENRPKTHRLGLPIKIHTHSLF